MVEGTCTAVSLSQLGASIPYYVKRRPPPLTLRQDKVTLVGTDSVIGVNLGLGPRQGQGLAPPAPPPLAPAPVYVKKITHTLILTYPLPQHITTPSHIPSHTTHFLLQHILLCNTLIHLVTPAPVYVKKITHTLTHPDIPLLSCGTYSYTTHEHPLYHMHPLSSTRLFALLVQLYTTLTPSNPL